MYFAICSKLQNQVGAFGILNTQFKSQMKVVPNTKNGPVRIKKFDLRSGQCD